jgi:hypothetical protein
MFLRNAGIYLQVQTTLQPRTTTSKFLEMYGPQLSYYIQEYIRSCLMDP